LLPSLFTLVDGSGVGGRGEFCGRPRGPDGSDAVRGSGGVSSRGGPAADLGGFQPTLSLSTNHAQGGNAGPGGLFGLNIAYGAISLLGGVLDGLGLNPGAGTITSVEQLLGESVRGRWEIVFLFLMLLLFNVVGEELWWRGIILPRQELTHGRWTWVVHGLLWTAFHAFKWWDLLGLLPVCLLIAFISQRTKNNWPALIAHLLFNGLTLILVVAAVLGT